MMGGCRTLSDWPARPVEMLWVRAMPQEDITQILRELSDGESEAVRLLLPIVYPELKAMAHRRLSPNARDVTLDTTALVHEAYLRLLGQKGVAWADRAHFFAIASTMMRRILVDHARARLAGKRAHRELPLSVATGLPAAGGREVELLDLDRALDLLAREQPRTVRIVEMRFFGGLENAEIGAVLELSERTVEREWSFARAFLRRELARAHA